MELVSKIKDDNSGFHHKRLWDSVLSHTVQYKNSLQIYLWFVRLNIFTDN